MNNKNQRQKANKKFIGNLIVNDQNNRFKIPYKLSQMQNLYQIKRLKGATTEVFSPAHLKFVAEKTGDTLFLNSLNAIKSIAVLEFVPHAGIRGNHYHKSKQEIIYIVNGRVRLYLWVPDQPALEEIIVESGDLITIQPKLSHAFKAIKQTFALKISLERYDPLDTVPDRRIRNSC